MAAKGIQFIIGRPKRATTTAVQSVAFHKNTWTVARAKTWLKRHGLKYGKHEQTKSYYRFEQRPAAQFQKLHYSTIEPGKKKRATRKAKQTKKRRPSKRPKARKINPAQATEAQVQEAISRFTGFRGDPPASVDRIQLPALDPVMLTMGECDGIMYHTIRDGRTEKYIHQFKKKSRPLLCVSSDGRQLYLIGGSYSVTDRGIEDA